MAKINISTHFINVTPLDIIMMLGLAAAIVFVLILLYCYTVNNDDYIEGFWVADNDAFTDRAGIKSMMVYIGKDSGTEWLRTARECYVVINDNVANEAFTMRYWRSWNMRPRQYEIRPDLQFDGVAAIWPDAAEWKFDVKNGTLKIMDSTTIYAELYKNHDITDMTK